MCFAMPRIYVFAIGCLLVGTVSAAPSYSYRNLGTLGGGLSSAAAINAAGQIVGTSANAAGIDRATLWSANGIVDLGTTGGIYSRANAINSQNEVVGSSAVGGGDQLRAASWSGNQATALPGLGGKASYAMGVNNGGIRVGAAGIVGGAEHATRWNGTTVTDLGTLGGFSSYAHAINDGGTIVGAAGTAMEDMHATRWDGNQAVDLGTLGGNFSWAYAINNAGQTVGYSSTTGELASRATIWNGNVASELFTGAWNNSMATGINASGLVVGKAWNEIGGEHAVLWDGTAMFDLNSFLDAASVKAGWVLRSANGINDDGWIVGNAYNTLTGHTNAFLLSAVPEPAMLSLLLAGFLVIGAGTLLRKDKQRDAMMAGV